MVSAGRESTPEAIVVDRWVPDLCRFAQFHFGHGVRQFGTEKPLHQWGRNVDTATRTRSGGNPLRIQQPLHLLPLGATLFVDLSSSTRAYPLLRVALHLPMTVLQRTTGTARTKATRTRFARKFCCESLEQAPGVLCFEKSHRTLRWDVTGRGSMRAMEQERLDDIHWSAKQARQIYPGGCEMKPTSARGSVIALRGGFVGGKKSSKRIWGSSGLSSDIQLCFPREGVGGQIGEAAPGQINLVFFKSTPFMEDMRADDRPFQLETVDIHAAGNAAWKKKYVYWIPALHLDGQEIVKGRWDATDVTKALEQWDQNQQQAESTSEKPENNSFFFWAFERDWWLLPSYMELPFFFSCLFLCAWEPSGIYTRHTSDDPLDDDIHPLGAPRVPTPDPYAAAGPRCFNCSEITHVLSACPHPLDKALIALSRQIFEFERAGDGTPRSLREVAERLERAGWAGAGGGGFVPGKLSPELRRAVRWREWWDEEDWTVEEDVAGKDDGQGYEWLANMALWGYPAGWVSASDPRERMRARIMHERDPMDEDGEEEEDVMKIWGEGGEEEIMLSGPDRTEEDSLAGDQTDSDGDETTEDGGLDHNATTPELKRWAHYPATHFAWERLTVYDGSLLSQRGQNKKPSGPAPSLPSRPPEPAGPPPPPPPPPPPQPPPPPPSFPPPPRPSPAPAPYPYQYWPGYGYPSGYMYGLPPPQPMAYPTPQIGHELPPQQVENARADLSNNLVLQRPSQTASSGHAVDDDEEEEMDLSD
ncbi:hypothetical protein B0H19DRAFT_1082094 [Mycena capillaripes]|nr:hypothetical protein B0H19DRAFT_1082094 [Mycena capillaripes]